MNRTSVVIQRIEVVPVSFRLKTPFVTAAGHKTETQNVQIRLYLSSRRVGVAEASSSLAMRSESQANLQRALRELIPELRGQPIDRYRDLAARCWRLQRFHPTAAAAMECALVDAYTKEKEQPLFRFFGGKKQKIETDLTLSIAEPAALAIQAKAAVKRGFRRLKIKLAGNAPDKDFERLQAVRQAAPAALLVADGNQGFRVTQAVELVKRLERAGIKLHFFEQPFGKHDFPSMRQFRNRCKLPLFADESVFTAADAIRLFESGAADGVNVKVAKSGLLGCLDIIRIAERFQKRLAIGCMEESKLGLAASVHLACGTGVFEWVDLDSVFLLEPSRLRGGFTIKGAKLSVSGALPGVGL
jgi:L-Ala-D/L-Glu epimerase